MKSEVSKKTTVNLAIDSHVLEKLRKEASSQNISLNGKINSVLLKHVDFHRWNEDFGCVIWDHRVFLSFLDLIDDESKILNVFWNEGGANVMAYFNHNNIPVNKENIIKHICERLGIWTGHYTFFNHYTDSEGHTCLVFDHKFGLKWSRILASLHSRPFEHWLGLKTVANITSNTVVLKIIERDVD